MRLSHSSKPQEPPKVSPTSKGEGLDVSLPGANLLRVEAPLPPPTEATAYPGVAQALAQGDTRVKEYSVDPEFCDYLIDACTAQKAGFHFEEGGCYGMALALRPHLGPDAKFAITEGFSHAYVFANGRFYDHQGSRHFLRTPFRVIDDEDGLKDAARMAGWDTEEVEADREWASLVIEQAAAFAANPETVEPYRQ